MFGGRINNSDCPIGVDVGDHGVRLIQLSTRSGQLAATAAAHVPLPGGKPAGDEAYHAAVTDAIREALGRTTFTGHRAVSALPAAALQCKNLRLPKMPADELAAAVQWEATDRFRFEQGQASVQFLNAGQVSQGDEQRQEVILLAAKLGFVEKHVAALTENGLRPRAIDAIPTALARTLSASAHENQAGEDASAHVLIDVGQSVTKVLIVRAGRVLFYKPIEVGGTSFDSVLSGALEIPLDQAEPLRRALADGSSAELDAARRRAATEALGGGITELGREIGLCLRYYGVTFRGPRPERAALLGGVAAPWLAELLGPASGLTLEVDNPLQAIDLEAVRGVVHPGTEHAWAVAAGLSLRDHALTKRRANPDASAKGVAA